MGTSKAGVFRGLAATLVLLLLRAQVRAGGFAGRMMGVSDGDTPAVLTESERQLRVRLAEVDTPESVQPYSSRAPEAGGDGGAECRPLRPHGGRVPAGRRYQLRNNSLWRGCTGAATAVSGCWCLNPGRTARPVGVAGDRARAAVGATRRRAKRTVGGWRSVSLAGRGGPACGTKRTCDRVVSCAEAWSHHECRELSRLDGDRGGVPRERLCQW